MLHKIEENILRCLQPSDELYEKDTEGKESRILLSNHLKYYLNS